MAQRIGIQHLNIGALGLILDTVQPPSVTPQNHPKLNGCMLYTILSGGIMHDFIALCMLFLVSKFPSGCCRIRQPKPCVCKNMSSRSTESLKQAGLVSGCPSTFHARAYQELKVGVGRCGVSVGGGSTQTYLDLAGKASTSVPRLLAAHPAPHKPGSWTQSLRGSSAWLHP